MEIGTRITLLSVTVTLLLCGLVTGTGEGGSDRMSCDLSIFSTIPPVTMKTFQHFWNHYVRIRSLPYSDPLVASLDDVKRLSVPERRVLIRAEFQLFAEILGHVTEETLGVFGRRARETLALITVKLSECVMVDALNADQYSTDLSHLLKRLEDVKDMGNPASSADNVAANLMQVLNEHLTCAARGTSC